ncbi:DUF4279 domain-containing protein [Leptospira meyeri]|uniref:DUF4279 domain-containing protein n=1 Tax=Leptospira meyeri TaxID=29508 RepID=UPI0002BE7E3F|nr:DUF4279 domain-containing protein [Leptospira meyeri]EMJ87262.1 hypothetical protein LEP1GSC196_2969 [Leptospira meyeri serovar Semaranga str. Veldrot Semarang 173]
MINDLKPISKKDLKKLSNTQTSNTNRLIINLIVDKLKINPNLIYITTLLKPSFIEIKGESHINKQGARILNETNFWSFERKYKNIIYPEKKILQFIMKYLEPNSTYFQKTFKNSEAKLEIVYYHYTSNNPGIFLSKKITNLIGKYSLSLEFDIYCLYE